MNFSSFGVFITLAAVTVSTSFAQVQRFQVDAQYRGAVKKSFNSIGTTGIKVTPGANGSFKIAGQGRVVHPKDKAKVFEFNVDMDFQLSGNKVSYLKTNNTCAAGSEGLRSKIERLLPFLHLVAALPITPEARTIQTPHGSYTVREAQTEKYTEVTVEEGENVTGKFFLTKENGQLNIERFRIPTKDNVVLNFVASAN